VVIAIIAISVLLVAHEYGHYLVAKRLHYEVTGFGVGFGPVIYKRKHGETEFRLGIIPFGAYVEVPAMDGQGASIIRPLHKVAIAVAGPLMNFVLAFIIIFVVLIAGNPTEPSTTIASIVPNSPASQVLQVGDKILQIDGQNVADYSQFQQTISKKNVGEPVELLIQRDNQQLKVRLTVENISYDGQKFVGIGITAAPKKYSPVDAFVKSFSEVWLMIEQLWQGLILLVTRPKTTEVMGIIGITATMATFARSNFVVFLYLVSLISANLGFVNLIPFPALDGSLILTGLVESVIGKPLPQSWINVINAIGFVFLMGLMVYVSFLDVGRLIGL
jgi:regulator of sigma E protease